MFIKANNRLCGVTTVTSAESLKISVVNPE